MPRCGRCGKSHESVQQVKDCHATRRQQRPSSQSVNGKSKPSKTGQVWEPPVDPEGAKRATPQFDKENREPYN